ncbi:MAG: LysR family transcriptional regulator [Sandaracinaceae bacterium]|nr:LysR family transcriptional regulator [Sandaracinaceae bacterium]
MSSLDWNDLKYAIAVAETGTLTAAARRLRVSQPTAGRRIAALERALGVPLFLRASHGLVPTPAGLRLLESMGALARELDAIEHGGLSDPSALRGTVRLAATEATTQSLLERALPELRARHPDIVCELHTSNAVADLSKGQADLAVRLVKPEPADLVARKVGSVVYSLYASAEYLARRGADRATGSLAGHDVVVPSGELAGGPEAQWLGADLRGGSPSVRINSVLALARAAASGMGLVVLATTIGGVYPGLRSAAALREIPARSIYLVTHRDTRGLARIRAVADAVTEDLERRLRRGQHPDR